MQLKKKKPRENAVSRTLSPPTASPQAFLEDTMMSAPYLRELLHCYSGYGRLSAREEQAHLKRLANYIPDNAHQSVKKFTERTLLSLQSNPGWGFEKKYLFTRKLVEDVAQHYKEKQKR